MIAGFLVAVALAGPHRPLTPTDTIPGTNWTRADWTIFQAKVRWGLRHRVARLPLGRAIATLGATFVGTKYTPATLEVPGPERLVINLRELDCVTFVENTLALVRFIRAEGLGGLANPVEARVAFEGYLRALRYRGGVIDGYPSRLHYFSEWLSEQAGRGAVTLLARELGGVADSERINFMSTHRGSYRQLADSAALAMVAARETALTAGGPRWFLPKTGLAQVVDRIQDGDVIAATSTVPGLDIAHTGFAMWRGGKLHLLHAPLVGKSVEISPLPLADRIQGIRSQDGIMIARPIESGATGSGRRTARPQ